MHGEQLMHSVTASIAHVQTMLHVHMHGEQLMHSVTASIAHVQTMLYVHMHGEQLMHSVTASIAHVQTMLYVHMHACMENSSCTVSLHAWRTAHACTVSLHACMENSSCTHACMHGEELMHSVTACMQQQGAIIHYSEVYIYLGYLDELLHCLDSLVQILVLQDAVCHPVAHLCIYRLVI